VPDPSPTDGGTEQADRPLPPDAVLRALHQTGILILDRDGTYRQTWLASDIQEQ